MGDKATQFSFVRITDLEIGFPAGNGIRRLTDDSCQIRGARKIDAHFQVHRARDYFATLPLLCLCSQPTNITWNIILNGKTGPILFF